MEHLIHHVAGEQLKSNEVKWIGLQSGVAKSAV